MAPVQGVGAMSPEDQLEDLRRRFTLLEGERKANFETAAMSIKQNKEIIQQMRLENENMKKEIAKLKDKKPQTIEQQLDTEMSLVQGKQRKLDSMRAENKKKSQNLESLDGKLQELSMGSKIHSSEASPEMRQIRVLENRLDKAMIKHNEANSIKKTYEAIVKRLKEERIGFDNQLAAIEHTLKSKERDYEELLLLSHDAYHAKEMAQAELHRFEQGVMDERCQRDREVQEKKALVEQRVAMNRRLEAHQKQLQKQAEQEKQQERELQEQTAATELAGGLSSDYAQEEMQKLEDYEEAFHVIKEATGVDDVNEIIQKFLTQEDTHKNLTKLTKENQASVDRLTEDRRKIRLQVEELKFSSGGAANRRQAIDEKEARFAEAAEKFERNKGKFERLAKMLIDTKAGIEHLGGKLTPIKLENENAMEMSDETVEDLLQQCELKISKLLRQTHQVEDDPADRKRMLEDERFEEKLLLTQSGVRIKLMDKEEDVDDDEDAYEEELDEEVSHRTQVKYNSEQILLKQQNKNRKKGKKKEAA